MSFFPIEECDSGGIGDRNRIASLFDSPGACLVRGLYGAAALAPVVAALEGDIEQRLRRFRFSPRFEAYSFGRILDQADDLAEYFAEAERYRALCLELFAHTDALESRLLQALGRLAGSSPLAVPNHPTHGRYALSTIRSYPRGGLVPPHVEIEQLRRSSFSELRPRIEGRALLSFVLLLSEPERGGELVVYDVQCDSREGLKVFANRDRAGELLASHPAVVLPVHEGDLLVFNGATRFHEVKPVAGARSRWTVGGFCAQRRDAGYFAFS